MHPEARDLANSVEFNGWMQPDKNRKAKLVEGNLVTAGGSDPRMTTILSTDPVRVYFNVDERSLQRYAQGQNAAGKNVTELLAALKDAQIDFTFALEGERDFK